MRRSLLRTKPLAEMMAGTAEDGRRLKKRLGPWELTALGIGCIIGVGIFVLPGVQAARNAGPGIVLSFAIAASACACAALCYAELAAMIPVAGSAYTYGYATLGELPAWIIGWDLILEYMVAAVMVATGWSAYLVNFLRIVGIAVPQSIAASPWDRDPGLFNAPAVLIVAALTLILVRGIRESSRVNVAIVVFKLAVIAFFIVLSSGHVKPANWHPFLPFGVGGMLRAAAIVFLAYVGFDAVSTAAEEAVNPQRDMPIGIIGSLAVATVLYIVVAGIMTGIVPYAELDVADPVAHVLNHLNMPWASVVVSIGAMAGITSVLLVLLLGQPRILFAMSRDGLLPHQLAKVHPRFGTPHVTTIATGLIVAAAAAFTPIDVSSALCSIGTLFAFMIVCAGVIVLRYVRPDLPRPFRTPLFPVLPAAGIVACAVLMANLPWTAWERFLSWLAIGLLLYFAYGRRHSLLSRSGHKGS